VEHFDPLLRSSPASCTHEDTEREPTKLRHMLGSGPDLDRIWRVLSAKTRGPKLPIFVSFNDILFATAPKRFCALT